jgi:hypothetical protein
MPPNLREPLFPQVLRNPFSLEIPENACHSFLALQACPPIFGLFVFLRM